MSWMVAGPYARSDTRGGLDPACTDEEGEAGKLALRPILGGVHRLDRLPAVLVSDDDVPTGGTGLVVAEIRLRHDRRGAVADLLDGVQRRGTRPRRRVPAQPRPARGPGARSRPAARPGESSGEPSRRERAVAALGLEASSARTRIVPADLGDRDCRILGCWVAGETGDGRSTNRARWQSARYVNLHGRKTVTEHETFEDAVTAQLLDDKLRAGLDVMERVDELRRGEAHQALKHVDGPA